MNANTVYPAAHDVWYAVAMEKIRQFDATGKVHSADDAIKYATAVADAYKEYVSKLS